MSKILAMLAVLMGLAACHAGFGISDNDQHPTYAVSNPWESALAQASIGTVPATSTSVP